MKLLHLHPWNVSAQEAILIQIGLQPKIRLRPLLGGYKLIAGADVSFRQNKARGAVVVMAYPDFKIVEVVKKELTVSYPYIPTLLTFREAPPLLACFKSLKNKPDLVIFDGQGIAHPRKMGLATHLGILLSLPTIGCAKSRLFGTFKHIKLKKGSYSYLKDNHGKVIGAALRSREGVKPIFVSPGHKLNIKDSIDITLRCVQKYRLPEPIRCAHNLTRV